MQWKLYKGGDLMRRRILEILKLIIYYIYKELEKIRKF